MYYVTTSVDGIITPDGPHISFFRISSSHHFTDETDTFFSLYYRSQYWAGGYVIHQISKEGFFFMFGVVLLG